MSVWLNGRAPDHGSGGCRFESCHGCSFVRATENVVDDEGFEPSTFRMQNGRSTTELNAHRLLLLLLLPSGWFAAAAARSNSNNQHPNERWMMAAAGIV